MPTYEYRCPAGHDFEHFYRKMSDAPAVVLCPTCAKVAERRMSEAGLHFKGSGFYITDYGKDGKKAQSAPVAEGEGSKGGERSKEGEGTKGGDGSKKTESAPQGGSASSGGESAPSPAKAADAKPSQPKSSSSGSKSSGSE